MGSLNKTIIAGRLTRDPKVAYTDKDRPITTFTIAVNRVFKNGQKEAQFIDCVTWGKLAKISGEYLKKGRLVAVEGRLQIKRFTGKDGIKKQRAEVVASDMQMLDSRKPAETAEVEVA